MFKIATPVSHLFENIENANLIIKHSDCLECRDHSVDVTFDKQELFHCDLQLIHELSDKQFLYLRNIKKTKPDIKLISFHAASCYDKPLLVNHIFQPGGKKHTVEEMYNAAKKNIKEIRNIFGNEILNFDLTYTGSIMGSRCQIYHRS